MCVCERGDDHMCLYMCVCERERVWGMLTCLCERVGCSHVSVCELVGVFTCVCMCFVWIYAGVFVYMDMYTCVRVYLSVFLLSKCLLVCALVCACMSAWECWCKYVYKYICISKHNCVGAGKDENERVEGCINLYRIFPE